MSLIPIDSDHIKLALQNDAQQLRSTISWVLERYTTYNWNMGVNNLTAAGISADDQGKILALAADFARLKDFMTGTLPGVAADIRVDVVNIIGVM